MLFSISSGRYTIGRRHHLSLKFTTQLKRYINKQQTISDTLNTLSVKGTWSKMELLFLKQSRLNSSLLFSKTNSQLTEFLSLLGHQKGCCSFQVRLRALPTCLFGNPMKEACPI